MKKIVFTLLTLVFCLPIMAQYWDSPLQNTNLPQSRGIQTISVIDSNVVWADTYDGTGGGAAVHDFIRTTDGGVTWVPSEITNVPAGWEFSHFVGVSDTMAWVVCYNASVAGAHVYRTTNGGFSWVEKNPFTASAFGNVVHFFNANEGMLMGDPEGGYFEIYTTTTQGDAWLRVPSTNIPAPLSGEYGLVRSIGAYGDNVWFGTNKSRIFRSIDKGYTWSVTNVAPVVGANATVSTFAMESASTGMCFASGADTVNRVLKTIDGGVTWTQVLSNTQKAGFIKWRNDIANVKGTSRYFVTGARFTTGDHGSVYTDDYGLTWKTVDSAVQHLGTAWANPRHGWSGSFTGAGGVEGMFKWSDTTHYTIALSESPLGSAVTSGGGVFTAGMSATPTVTPNTGYTFAYWEENGTPYSSNTSFTIPVIASRSFVAVCVADTAHFTIDVSAAPVAGGTVTGGGSYAAVAPVTVTATANTGYAFVNWTENGNIVSTNSTYSFLAVANRVLVANFTAVNYNVVLSSLPVAGGTTMGGGSYQEGSAVSVMAMPNANYGFVNWTENGNIVSTTATYNFTITANRNLVAHFTPLIGIEPSALESKLSVYPNPSQGTLHINSLANLHLEVFNTLGQTVLSQAITEGDNSIEIEETGVYMFVFTKEGELPYTVKVFNNK